MNTEDDSLLDIAPCSLVSIFRTKIVHRPDDGGSTQLLNVGLL
jgi:hypothetical protein